MESRLLRIGWIIMLILGIFLILGAIFTLIGGWQQGAWMQMTGKTWDSFVSANSAQTAETVMTMMKMDGVAQIAIGALIIMIAIFAYRRGEKWSWYALLAGGIIYWVGHLIHELTSGGPLPWVIIGLVLLIIALALPAKHILSK